MELLPKEILVQVFKHLPQRDRMTVAEVCTLFSAIIDKFHLIERFYIDENHTDESSTPTRKYTEATVSDYKDGYKKIFEATGKHLITLKLEHCTLKLIDIVNILRLTPNIKNLTLSYIRLDFGSDETLSESVQLPQLIDINLLMNESNPKIFSVLLKSSISKVNLQYYGDVPYSNFSEFVKLLKTQHNLTSFTMQGIYESSLFIQPMGKSNYRLKEFSIDNCDLEEWDVLESYLIEHVESLDKFTIKSVRWDPSNFLNQSKRLKTLQCHRVEMNYIDVLPSIEELSLEPPIQMMDKFPNVKRLFISRSSPVTFQMITNVMNKLEEMEITYGELTGLEVSGLKKLKLSSLDGTIQANFFVTHHRIEELQLVYVSNIDDSLLEAITANLTNLRVLRILGDNHLTSRAFTIIKNNCKKLKVFEMTKWDQKFKREDWKCLLEINGLQVYTEKFD